MSLNPTARLAKESTKQLSGSRTPAVRRLEQGLTLSVESFEAETSIRESDDHDTRYTAATCPRKDATNLKERTVVRTGSKPVCSNLRPLALPTFQSDRPTI